MFHTKNCVSRVLGRLEYKNEVGLWGSDCTTKLNASSTNKKNHPAFITWLHPTNIEK